MGDDAELTDCVVADDVVIPAGARFEGCAIVRRLAPSRGPGEEIDGDLLLSRMPGARRR